MHQYSRKFGGSQAERRKFLTKRKKKTVGDNDAEQDLNERPQAARSAALAGDEVRHAETKKNATKRKQGKKTAIESVVEEAVNETL